MKEKDGTFENELGFLLELKNNQPIHLINNRQFYKFLDEMIKYETNLFFISSSDLIQIIPFDSI